MTIEKVLEDIRRGDATAHLGIVIKGDTVEDKANHIMEILRGQMLDVLVNGMTSGDHRALMEHRGGCSCPNGNPPCSACVEPLSWDEAMELGWLEE